MKRTRKSDATLDTMLDDRVALQIRLNTMENPETDTWADTGDTIKSIADLDRRIAAHRRTDHA